eukprot:scaffold5726_cov119-Skeletonema_dohrnii-CCMP3373.AAC.3
MMPRLMKSFWLNVEVMAAIPNWTSSGHLRRCSSADTHVTYDVVATPIRPMKASAVVNILLFYTIVTNYNGPLQAVDCHTHSARYDMVQSSAGAGGHPKLGLIRSPTTL